MTVSLTIPDILTLREGEARNLGIVFGNLHSHSISWQYVAGPLGGTAGTGDISGVSGSGSMSIRANPPVTRSTSFNAAALRDDVTEGTETASVRVSVIGMPFADGSYSRLVEIRILDDNMIEGTAGNDHYHVTVGDVVVEATTGGNDTISSATSWVLGAHVENLALTSTAAINGTGNALDNRITGNADNNVLVSGAGNDTLRGEDRLVGGAGTDVLSGGSEAAQRDVFVFHRITDSAVGAARDRLVDFQRGTDVIDLGAIDANTRLAGDQAFAFSGTTAAANSVWYTQTGAHLVVRLDHDGDSRADFELLVQGQSSLTAADFLL